MGPIEHIRKNILAVSQAVLAEIAGVTQATVSRWENNELEPGREAMGLIRDAARERGIDWDDRLFFEVPHATEQRPAGASAP